MNSIILNIDRIILSDLDLTPVRAELIREMLGAELKSLLERQGLPDGVATKEVSCLSAPVLHLENQQNDFHVASSLAQSIAKALWGVA